MGKSSIGLPDLVFVAASWPAVSWGTLVSTRGGGAGGAPDEPPDPEPPPEPEPPPDPDPPDDSSSGVGVGVMPSNFATAAFRAGSEYVTYDAVGPPRLAGKLTCTTGASDAEASSLASVIRSPSLRMSTVTYCCRMSLSLL